LVKCAATFYTNSTWILFSRFRLWNRQNNYRRYSHVLIGLSIFYLVILRLIYKIFNPTPKLEPSVFKGQRFLAKLNHVMLYVTILSITISGILKKLFNGETLTIIFNKIKIQDNFELAELFYDIHVISNYLLIALILMHILAVVAHKLFFNDNLLKKIL
jgi:cytochrome b561